MSQKSKLYVFKSRNNPPIYRALKLVRKGSKKVWTAHHIIVCKTETEPKINIYTSHFSPKGEEITNLFSNWEKLRK